MKKKCELLLIVHGKVDEGKAAELFEYAAEYKKRKGPKTSARQLLEILLPSTASEDVSFEIRRESE